MKMLVAVLSSSAVALGLTLGASFMLPVGAIFTDEVEG